MTIRVFDAATATLADFNAARILGFDFSVTDPVTATIDDDDTLNADPTSSVTIGDDAQGPITGVTFHRVSDAATSGGFEIAAVEREDVADFLLLVIDPDTGDITNDTLPSGSYGYTEEFTPDATPGYARENDAPTGIALDATPLPEDAPGDAIAGRIVGTDPDDDDVLTYTLVDDAGGLFVLDTALDADGNAVLLTAPDATFDFESRTSYTVVVRATDLAGESIDRTLTVSIADVNEAPNAPNLLMASPIDENSPGGTVVGTVAASDPDAGDSATVVLIGDAGDAFVLIDDRLEVAPGADLDFEEGGFRAVTIQATDTSGRTTTSDFAVELVDVNEAPFVPLISNRTIREDSEAGALVGIVFGEDPDFGDFPTFSLVDDAGGRFVLDGNQLEVAAGADLDFDTTESYDVRIEAADDEGLTTEGTIRIDVLEEDTAVVPPVVNPPPLRTFSPTAITLATPSIDENSIPGTIVGSLAVTDRDQASGHRLTLLDDADGQFALDGNSIVVAPGAVLDHETASTLEIEVVAQDTDGNAIRQRIEISVDDVDDAPIALSAQIIGTDADDRLEITESRVRVNGLEGRDTAVFDASVDDYQFQETLVGYRLLPNDTGGQINLISIERIEFDDATLELVSNESTGSIQRVYKTVLDREADPLGGAYWSGQLESGAVSLADIADAFTTAPEFIDIYGDSLTNADFVDNLYGTGLQREADEAGKVHWTGELDDGSIDRGDALIAFSESEEARNLYAGDTDSGLLIFA